MKKKSYPSADGAIIERVVLVDQLRRDERVTYQSHSLPGHLIHLVTAGETLQETNGLSYTLIPNTVVWYSEDEAVKGKIIKTPWIFYTVNFIAPMLSPPAYDQRVLQVDESVSQQFARLLSIWRDETYLPALRHMEIHARLLDIIISLLRHHQFTYRIDPATRLWWEIEKIIKQDLSKPISLRTLASLTHLSQRTIARSAECAVGLSPMKRIKEIRLSMARGLLLYSDLSITEIAYNVAYTRVQEFSRDYKVQYGVTPSEDRKGGPDYRTLPQKLKL